MSRYRTIDLRDKRLVCRDEKFMSANEIVEELQDLEQRLAAANGRLEEYEEKTCNCRWEGDTLVRQCELHKAQVDAIHEWAERAKVAEQRLWKLGLRNYQKRPVQTGNGSEGSDDI